MVTGASAGIGRAIAVALGALGWPVALGARRVDQLEETAALVRAAGGTAYAHELDVCDPASIDPFVAASTGALGPIDVLVNNAGTAAPGALHEMDDDVHTRIVTTNLLGPILVTKRIVADLRAVAAPGDIVFISSGRDRAPPSLLGTYGSSKAGLEAFATTLALECEDFPIRHRSSASARRSPVLPRAGTRSMFVAIMPRWQRFGIQRHFNMMQPEDIAPRVVSTSPRRPHVDPARGGAAAAADRRQPEEPAT